MLSWYYRNMVYFLPIYGLFVVLSARMDFQSWSQMDQSYIATIVVDQCFHSCRCGLYIYSMATILAYNYSLQTCLITIIFGRLKEKRVKRKNTNLEIWSPRVFYYNWNLLVFLSKRYLVFETPSSNNWIIGKKKSYHLRKEKETLH